MSKSEGFLKSVYREMAMVSWPSKPIVWSSTKVVLAFSLFLLLFIFGIDQAIKWIVAFWM